MSAAVRTTAERIERIRRRLVNGLSGFQAADVAALLEEYDRLAADLEELKGGDPGHGG